VQLDVQASKNENLARVLSSVEKAGNQADLIVFPEYCMGFPQEGLSPKYLNDLAEPLTGEFVNSVVEATKRMQVTVVIPIFESGDGCVYNTAVVVDRGRVLGGYRKIHLFDALGSKESDLFGTGSNPVLFKVKEMVFGLTICYDIRFPELMRRWPGPKR
jgi:predicted amidohydrolase